MFLKSRHKVTVAATFALMFLLAIPGVAFAHQSKSQTVTLGLAGSFVHVGNQQYQESGGAATYVRIKDVSISLSSVSLTYSLNAVVDGSTVSGTASFTLTGTGSSSDGDDDDGNGGPVSVVAQAILVDMVPAAGFPLDPTQPTNPIACHPGCLSEIPAFFVGVGPVAVTSDGATTSIPNAVFLFESAYLNPFGGPIVMGTIDGAIRIAATYTSANGQWSGVQTAGVVLDPNGNPIGNFALTSNLAEDLLRGTESDTGNQMVLYGFSGQYEGLNSAGIFAGASVVPIEGSFDCTSALRAQLKAAGIDFRLPRNTCLATGSISTGGFDLKHDSDHPIKGTYGLQWSVPALGFGGTVTATLSDADDDGD